MRPGSRPNASRKRLPSRPSRGRSRARQSTRCKVFLVNNLISPMRINRREHSQQVSHRSLSQCRRMLQVMGRGLGDNQPQRRLNQQREQVWELECSDSKRRSQSRLAGVREAKAVPGKRCNLVKRRSYPTI